MVAPHRWTPNALLEDLSRFETFLAARCNVRLTDGVGINETFNHLLDLISAMDGETSVTKDRRVEFQGGLGVADLAVKTAVVLGNPELEKFCAHFALLLDEGALVHNTKTRENEDSTNKVFELATALSLLQATTNVELENPRTNAGPGNPDVLADFQGVRWSFACKVLNRRSNPKSYYDRVEDGLGQVQDALAQRGFVVVNLKNIFDYEKLWPPPILSGNMVQDGAWESPDVLGALAEEQVTRFLKNFEELFGGADHIDTLFLKFPKAVPWILNYANVTAPCWVNGQKTLTNLRMLIPLQLGSIDQQAQDLFNAFDRAVATP